MPKKTRSNKIDFVPYIKVIQMMDATYMVEVHKGGKYKILHKIKTNGE